MPVEMHLHPTPASSQWAQQPELGSWEAVWTLVPVSGKTRNFSAEEGGGQGVLWWGMDMLGRISKAEAGKEVT